MGFLEDWELARVAVSCHDGLYLLCQEMQDAWLCGSTCYQLLPTVAAFCRFFPSRMGCSSVERVARGGVRRYPNGTDN